MDDVDAEAYLRDPGDVSDFGRTSIWKEEEGEGIRSVRRGSASADETAKDAEPSFQIRKVSLETAPTEDGIETQGTPRAKATVLDVNGKRRGRNRWLSSDSEPDVEAPRGGIKTEPTTFEAKGNTHDGQGAQTVPSSWQQAIEISSTSEGSEGAPPVRPTLRTYFTPQSPAPRKTPKMRRLWVEDDKPDHQTSTMNSMHPCQENSTPHTPLEDNIEEISSLASDVDDDEEPDENMQVNHLGELCPVSSRRGGRGRGRGRGLGGKRPSGRWITDGSGKKVFVMSGGKRLSGSAAYKAYSGGNSKAPKKTKRRTKASRKPKREK